MQSNELRYQKQAFNITLTVKAFKTFVRFGNAESSELVTVTDDSFWEPGNETVKSQNKVSCET